MSMSRRWDLPANAGLYYGSSINGAVAAEQEGANTVFTSQKVALGFELKQFS